MRPLILAALVLAALAQPIAAHGEPDGHPYIMGGTLAGNCPTDHDGSNVGCVRVTVRGPRVHVRAEDHFFERVPMGLNFLNTRGTHTGFALACDEASHAVPPFTKTIAVYPMLLNQPDVDPPAFPTGCPLGSHAGATSGIVYIHFG